MRAVVLSAMPLSANTHNVPARHVCSDSEPGSRGQPGAARPYTTERSCPPDRPAWYRYTLVYRMKAARALVTGKLTASGRSHYKALRRHILVPANAVGNTGKHWQGYSAWVHGTNACVKRLLPSHRLRDTHTQRCPTAHRCKRREHHNIAATRASVARQGGPVAQRGSGDSSPVIGLGHSVIPPTPPCHLSAFRSCLSMHTMQGSRSDC